MIDEANPEKETECAAESFEEAKRKMNIHTDNHLLVSRTFYFISIYCHLVSCLQVCCFICSGHFFPSSFALVCCVCMCVCARASC